MRSADPDASTAAAQLRPLGGPFALLVAAVVLAALALRVEGLDRLLPHRPEPDTHFVTYVIAAARGLDPHAFDPRTAFYPSLVPRLVGLLPDATILAPAPAGAPLEQHLAAAARPYVLVRGLSATLGALLPLLAYAVARCFLGRWPSLLAAGFCALSVLQLVFSQQARPHSPHLTFAWLALWALLWQAQKPTPARVLLASLAVVLGVGVFQIGFFLVFPLAAAGLLSWRPLGRRAAWLLSGPLAVVLAVALFHPPPSISGSGVHLGGGGHSIRFAQLDGGGAPRILGALWGYEPALAVVAVLGACFALARVRRLGPGHAALRPLLVLAAYVVPYSALILLDSRTANRYLLPLLPALALLGAYGVAALWSALGPRGARGRLLAGALAVLALALPAWATLRFKRLSRAPDTIEQAARWLVEQTPQSGREVLTSSGLVLPALAQREAFDPSLPRPYEPASPLPRIAYQSDHAALLPAPQLDLRLVPRTLLRPGPGIEADLEAYLDSLPPCWIAVDVTRITQTNPGPAALRALLRRRAAPARVFAGEDERFAGGTALDYEGTVAMFSRLLRATAFGPRIEVYRWDRGVR